MAWTGRQLTATSPNVAAVKAVANEEESINILHLMGRARPSSVAANRFRPS